MADLVYLEKSSWSERALFALQLAGVELRTATKYTPFVDEPWLRWRMGAWTGKVSVPVLLTSSEPPIRGSRAIAEWAADRSAGKLPRGGDAAYLDRIEALTERVMMASRYRVCTRVMESRAFDECDVPSGPAQWLPRSVQRWIVMRVYAGLAAKYRRPGETMESDLADMRAGLSELRAVLSEAGGARFARGSGPESPPSVADLMVATCMHFAPLPGGRVPFGPNVRAQFREPDLESEFADLLAWRDALYASFRS